MEEACIGDCLSFEYNDDLKCYHMEGACAKGNNFLYQSKGQIMSECIYEIIDLPKYHRKNFIDFFPGIFFRLGTSATLFLNNANKGAQQSTEVHT